MKLLTIRNRAFPAPDVDAGRSGDVASVDAAKSEDDLSVKVMGFEGTQGEVSLTDAGIIVSGGRGVGGPEGYEPIQETC